MNQVSEENKSSSVGAKRLRWLKRALIFLAALVLVWGLMITFLQRTILFPRHLCQEEPSALDQVEGAELWTLDTDEGVVEAFFIPGKGVSPEAPGPAVIYAHGNAELIDHWPDRMGFYTQLGISVLLPEFRGYGRSAGSPSQEAITEDFFHFQLRLLEREEVDSDRIFYHGRSLGGGVVCALAALAPPKALVLESTFTSVVDMAKGFLVPGFLIKDPFESKKVVESFDGPILIFHGDKDRVVPFPHGEALAKAGKAVTFVPRSCGHNDCPRDKVYWDAIQELLRGASLLK